MKNIFKILLFLFMIFKSYGQDNLISPMFFLDYDLTTLQVELLDEEEINKISNELNARKIDINDLENLAIVNGMSLNEFSKLKTRIENLNKLNNSDLLDEITVKNVNTPLNKNKKRIITKKINSEIFGSELFFGDLNLDNLNKTNLPPPSSDYIIGPGDELEIVIYGTQQLKIKSTVLNDGNLRIPNVGYFFVSGSSLKSVRKRIKKDFSRVYTSLSDNSSTLNINISKLRTVNVLVIGALKPGNYLLSSANTVFDAIGLAGGPNENGSFRKIEIIRNNKVLKVLDLYQFLSSNSVQNNLNLTNNDIIRIPNFINRVRVKGEANRPGVFEIKNGETFSDLVKYFQGFSKNAYSKVVKVTKKTSKELKLYEIYSDKFNAYTPENGDVFEIDKILNRYENRVEILGAVFRPGEFSLDKKMRISDLILKADGITENANYSSGRLVRLNDDLSKKIINFNITKALNEDPKENHFLVREDIIEIYTNSIVKKHIEIYGEILNPGKYDFFPGMTVEDLILKAGGFTDKSSLKIDVSSKTVADKISFESKNLIKNIGLNFNNSKDYKLSSYDVVNVRIKPVFETPTLITIKGEVNYPGKYSINDYNENISNYIERAGGFTKYANTSSIRVIRQNKADIKNDDLKEVSAFSDIEKIKIIKDSLNPIIDNVEITIPIELTKNGKSKNNIVFEPNDIILVLKKSNGVRVEGQVVLNSEIIYKNSKSLAYYVNSSGGVSPTGSLKNSYVVYPNGSANKTKSFLFLRFYPRITAGSRIVVPEEKVKQKLSTGELIGLSGMLTSVAGLIVSLLN